MPAGTQVRPGDLAKKLESLDIDEGIRIESGKNKLFVNKSPSGTFVVQFGNSDDFRYLDSARQVVYLAKKSLGKGIIAWIY